MKQFITFLLAILFATAVHANNDVDCLSKAIYHEARGQSIEGQIAVGWVVLNRTFSERFPSTICEVVYQHRQFSWTRKVPKITDLNAFELAKELANNIINRIYYDPTNGALFFNSLGMKPSYRSRLTLKLEQHYFYR